jgi:hypothetical protein
MKNLLTTAKMALKGEISSWERRFENRDEEDYFTAATALSQLAVNRYGLKLVKTIDTTQTENRLETILHVPDLDLPSTVMVCLAAIQSVGTEASGRFEEVATELTAN